MRKLTYLIIAILLIGIFVGCETVAEQEAKSKEVTAENTANKQESQAELFFSWGVDYLNAKNYERALINFQKAAKESTDYIDAYIYVGKTYQAKGDYIAADSVYKSLKIKYPDCSDVYRARAKMLIEIDKKDEAKKEYKMAIEKQPKDGLAWAGLGWFEKEAGNYEKAKEYYEKASQYSPDNLSICFVLGDLYIKTKQPMKAITLLERVVADHPRSIDARNKLTQAYLDAKQYDKAIAQLEELKKLRPSSEAKYLLYQGQCYEDSKQYKKAIETYKQVVDKYPDNANGYLALAQLYFSIKQYSNARLYANKLLKLQPNNAYAYYTIANTYLMQAKYDKAISYYNKVLKYGDATLKKSARASIKKAEKAKEDEEWNQGWGD